MASRVKLNFILIYRYNGSLRTVDIEAPNQVAAKAIAAQYLGTDNRRTGAELIEQRGSKVGGVAVYQTIASYNGGL